LRQLSHLSTAGRGARALGPVAWLAMAGALLAGCGPQDRSAAGLYHDYCVRCHGADGRGDRRSIGLYPNLDLTSAPLVRHRARGPIYLRIAEGYGPMPGFAHRFAHTEIEALVDYTLRFAPPADTPGAPRPLPPNPPSRPKAGR
jgi:mono/diheme cytochrome c family protein